MIQQLLHFPEIEVGKATDVLTLVLPKLALVVDLVPDLFCRFEGVPCNPLLISVSLREAFGKGKPDFA